MTSPDGYVPDGSVSDTGLAAFATKTQYSWQTDLNTQLTNRFLPAQLGFLNIFGSVAVAQQSANFANVSNTITKASTLAAAVSGGVWPSMIRSPVPQRPRWVRRGPEPRMVPGLARLARTVQGRRCGQRPVTAPAATLTATTHPCRLAFKLSWLWCRQHRQTVTVQVSHTPTCWGG